MSTIFMGTSFNTLESAAIACAECYITANGNNDPQEVNDYLSWTDNDGVLEDMDSDLWYWPEGTDHDLKLEAIQSVRDAF